MLLGWTYLDFAHRSPGKVYYKETKERSSLYEQPANPKQHNFFMENCYKKGITQMTLKEFNEKMRAESLPAEYQQYLQFSPRSARSVKYPSIPLDWLNFNYMTQFCEPPYDEKQMFYALQNLIQRVLHLEKTDIERLKSTRQIDNITEIIKNISTLVIREIKRYQ